MAGWFADRARRGRRIEQMLFLLNMRIRMSAIRRQITAAYGVHRMMRLLQSEALIWMLRMICQLMVK